MMISIDEKASTWFKKEFDFDKPFCIRMFPIYAGLGQKNKGYSLAFSAEAPTNTGFEKEIDGITFYVEDNDVWFFEETQTYLSADEHHLELEILYKEDSGSMIN